MRNADDIIKTQVQPKGFNSGHTKTVAKIGFAGFGILLLLAVAWVYYSEYKHKQFWKVKVQPKPESPQAERVAGRTLAEERAARQSFQQEA